MRRAFPIGRDSMNRQIHLQPIFLKDYESGKYCLELQARRGQKVKNQRGSR